MSESHCLTCGHPLDNHEAGECWTLPDGTEIWSDHPAQCRCYWLVPGAVDGTP